MKSNLKRDAQDFPTLVVSYEIIHARILGLKGELTKDDIDKAYRRIIIKYHPDKVASLGDELKQLAEKKTKEINQAYEYLKKRYH